MSEHRDGALPGGGLERALLVALWRRKRATIRELHDEVGGARGIVYTTVAKVVDRLVAKGLVRRRRAGERAYTYEAVAQRHATQRAMARGLIEHLVGGSEGPRPAIAALVGAMEDVSPDLLAALTTELEARRTRRRVR